MAALATQYAMGVDPVLGPRVTAAVIRLALMVLAEPIPGPETPDLERAAFGRRRAYAQDATGDVAAFARRAQFGVACSPLSELADAYETGAADAITDEALIDTLMTVWASTAGA